VDDPDLWRWIWLAAVGTFAVGEIVVAGSFFMAPFAVGALAGAITAFAGGSIAVQWLVFLVVSAGAAGALVPLRRRLDRVEPQDGIGSRRWLGQHAEVLAAIPPGPGATGRVRLGREEWRAESADGVPIAAGSIVKVVDVRGTGVVVRVEALRPPNPGGGSL
jgi:membrane protein implicated in regulation of membrane protease activity